MQGSARTVVAAAKSPSHTPTSLRRTFQNLLDNMDPPLPAMIKAGDRVLVKPFLHYGQNDPSSRLVSHPQTIERVIESLKDCGAIVSLGDVGSNKVRNESIRTEQQWIHDIAKKTGANPVSFAKTGGRQTRGGLHFPRSYLISSAVLDADHVINCANFQPHEVFLMSGAVKNMFNVVVGRCQQNLHNLFKNPTALAKVIVDVCKVIRPTITFLDLTTVRDPENDGTMHPVGLMLAGCDPVALDAIAAHAVGWDAATLPTVLWGEKRGLGCADLKKIRLSGLDWSELGTTRVSKVPPFVMQPEKLYAKTTRFINNTVLRARPVVVPLSCTGCGECEQICPVQSIHPAPGGTVSIRLRDCADCHLCIAVCETDAIALEFVGVGRAVRRLMHQTLTPGQQRPPVLQN